MKSFVIRGLCLFIFFSLLLISGCKKEPTIIEGKLTTNVEANTEISEDNKVTIEEAKRIFYNQDVDESLIQKYNAFTGGDNSTCMGVQPIWNLAREPQTLSEKGLTIVPIKMPKDVAAHGRGAQLVFYPDSSCDSPIELVFYEGFEYDETRPFHIENSSFKGFVSVVNFCDCSFFVFPIEDGELLAPIEPSFEFDSCAEDNAEERDMWPEWLAGLFNGGGPNCPKWGPGFWKSLGNFFGTVWDGISSMFSGGGSGNGSNSGSDTSNSWSDFSYTGFPYYNGTDGNISGGGGNSSTSVDNLFEGPFFNGEGQIVIDALNELIAVHDLAICTEQLHQTIYSCVNQNQTDYNTGPPPPPGENISLNAYISAISSMSTSASCLANVISSYSSDVDMEEADGSMLCYIQNNNNFEIADIDLLQLMKDECGTEAECNNELADCFNRLDVFQQEYGITINEEILLLMESNGFDFCGSEDVLFEEQVITYLAETMVDCGTYDFIWCNNLDDSPSGICPESFGLISVGTNSYSCDLSNVVFKYTGAINKTMFIGDLCITVPNQDVDGNPLTTFQASELLADAWDEAQDWTAQAYATSNHTMTSQAYKALFIANIKITMLGNFGGTFSQGTMSLINQKCMGSFPTKKPRYSFWC